MWIAGFTLFVLGLVFIIVSPINKKKNARCSAQTEGVLKEIYKTEDSSAGGGLGFIYTYYVNGIEYQLDSSASSPQTNDIGDKCVIWYNPKNPKDAQPFHYISNKVYTIILIVGIVMVILGIILFASGSAVSNL